MKRLRVAALLGVCALACAKREGAGTAAPQGDAEPTAGIADETAKKAEAEDAFGPQDLDEGDGAGVTLQQSSPATLEELTAALDEYEAELRAEGVRLKTYRKDKEKQTTHAKRVPAPAKPAEPAGAKKDDPRARICAIKASVCEIRSRICTLAAEHENEPRYAAACKRATNDCKRATEACDES